MLEVGVGTRWENKKRRLKERTVPTLFKILAVLGHIKGKMLAPNSSESFMNQHGQDCK